MTKVTQVIVMQLLSVTPQHRRGPANSFFFFPNTTICDLGPTRPDGSVFEVEWKDEAVISALLSREELRPIIGVSLFAFPLIALLHFCVEFIKHFPASASCD